MSARPRRAAAKKDAIEKSGVKFWELSKKDLDTLQYQGNVVHQQFAKEIGPQYLGQVQEFLGYKITRDMGGKQ